MLFDKGFPRTEPVPTQDTAPFWTGGAAGQLLITQCARCGFYSHPPSPACRRCRSMDVEPTAVSGRGTVFSYTVNYQHWSDTYHDPYIVARVELDEQEDLFLLTNIIDCQPETVSIGMPVQVDFDRLGDAWIPLFRPIPAN